VYSERQQPQDRKRFLYLTAINDYLKTNSHRIAHHALSRTSAPLASRGDIKPLLPLINGEIADIITLDMSSKKTFVKCMHFDDLVAHFEGDIALNDSLARIQEVDLDNIHFIFATNGILTPKLLEGDYTSQYPKVSQISFLEVRFDPDAIHKIGNPNIYLRKVVGQVREIGVNFNEIPGGNCECGGKMMLGTYKISYWGKSKSLEYSVCDNCGIQQESDENAGQVMTFMQGLAAE
jgi:hypothetical protein